jgi:pilus assembly protein FimV
VLPSPPPPAIKQRAVPPAPTFATATPPAPPVPKVTAPEPASAENESNHHEALELAEIMLSMGLASGAAQTLTEHIRHNPKQALHHWLKLLDVHRKSGNKQQFEESSRELQQHFNIQAENWAQLHAGEVTTLENYERVWRHIESVWRQPAEALNYLKHLLEDNRGGTRAGFPQPVAEEILLLIAILKETWGRS